MPFEIPEGAGRTGHYVVLRACERLDPRSVYGVPFYGGLEFEEQERFLAYDFLRREEERPK